MKLFKTTGLLISAMLFSLAAQAEVKQVHLDNTETQNLMLDQKTIRVSTSYPGLGISGVCAYDIVADSYNRHNAIARLLNEVEIQNLFDRDSAEVEVVSRTILRIPLRQGTFIDGIIIKAKGNTLKESATKALGPPSRKLVLIPRACEGNENEFGI